MKHKPVKQHSYYSIDEGKIVRKRQHCPRCGDSFLAQHKDRQVCGKCTYVKFLNVKS